MINRDFNERSEKYFSKKKTLKMMAEHGYGQGCVTYFSCRIGRFNGANGFFCMWVSFTPVGNYGPKTHENHARLIGENGHQSIKWPNSTIKMAIIQKSLLDISLPWEYCPKNIRQIWYNFYSFWEIIFSVQGLGQKKITVDQMSPVE